MQVSWGGGKLILLAIAALLSTNRRALNPRTVVGAPIIHGASAFVVLYWDFGRRMLRGLNERFGRDREAQAKIEQGLVSDSSTREEPYAR